MTKEFKFIEKPILKIPRSDYPMVDSVEGRYDTYDERNPKDFYSFADGVPLSEIEKQNFVDNIMDCFNKNPDLPWASTGTGNCMVIGFNREDEIEIMVIEKYMTASVRK
jgi:hypothetical protein